MLARLWGKSSDRKLRLLACACCRRQWHLLTNPRSRNGVEVAERFADGLATESERRLAEQGAVRSTWDFEVGTPSGNAASAVCLAIDPPVGVDAGAAVSYTSVSKDDSPAQAALVRELFANPFRPVTAIDPAWLAWNGGTVRTLAEVAYEVRRLPEGTLDPMRLALLADSLEDAGCDQAEVLAHLRSPGPHVRGCWAVDLVLGKK
jgi:hypothetical protein